MEIIDGADCEIDVETIMTTVRDRLDTQRAQRPLQPSQQPGGQPVAARPLPRSALTESFQSLEGLNRLHDPTPQGDIAPQGSALKRRVKRWVKRTLAPYHQKIFTRQASFNAHLVQLLNRLLPTLEAQDARYTQALSNLSSRVEAQDARYQQALSNLSSRVEAHDANHNYAAGLVKLQLDELATRNTELDRQLVDLLFLKDRIAEAWGRVESLRVEHDQALSSVYTQVEDLITFCSEQGRRLAGQVETFQQQLSSLDARGEAARQADGTQHRQQVEQLQSAHVELYRHVDEIKQATLLQARRLDLILTELRRKTGLDAQSVHKIAAVQERLLDHTYYLFEAQHRGSREEIKQRQEIYLPLFQARIATLKGAAGSPSPVLDVGCGRGELLELLREHGIPARGIDLNEAMVQLCRDRDLHVEHAGAIAYLRAQEDDTLGGVIACQVIEHLPTEELIEFVKLCHQKVVKGGLVVLETVNPTSVLVSATSFYVDLSHVRQVHPLTLQFLVEALGFLRPEVRFLSPYPDELTLQMLGEDGPEVQILNRNFARLNELLFGYQDYALICEK